MCEENRKRAKEYGREKGGKERKSAVMEEKSKGIWGKRGGKEKSAVREAGRQETKE